MRPRLAFARQPLGQENLKERLIGNVSPICEYLEVLDHGNR